MSISFSYYYLQAEIAKNQFEELRRASSPPQSATPSAHENIRPSAVGDALCPRKLSHPSIVLCVQILNPRYMGGMQGCRSGIPAPCGWDARCRSRIPALCGWGARCRSRTPRYMGWRATPKINVNKRAKYSIKGNYS